MRQRSAFGVNGGWQAKVSQRRMINNVLVSEKRDVVLFLTHCQEDVLLI